MATEVKVMDMAQFAEILKSDQRNVNFIQYSCKQSLLSSCDGSLQ
jgi:hypothetical protein